MGEKALRRLAICSVAFMLSVILVSIAFGKGSRVFMDIDADTFSKEQGVVLNNTDTPGRTKTNDSEMEVSGNDRQKVLPLKKEEQDRQLGESYIKIEKPGGTEKDLEISLCDLYMNRSIKISMTGLLHKNFNIGSITRVRNHIPYSGQPVAAEENGKEQESTANTAMTEKNLDGDMARDIKLSFEYDSGKKEYTVSIELILDQIYAYTIYADEMYFYIRLDKPQEVYNKILVIDAGHGGNDAGTYPEDMSCFEKDINLDIVLRLKKLLDVHKDIKVYYTRLSDEKVYLNPRVNLANELKADFFISVHCNSSEEKQAYGTEVLYRDQNGREGAACKELADLCVKELTAVLGTRNRGIVARNDIYIIGKAEVPTALIEVAYMSNDEELAFLKEEQNRILAAQGIYNGIMKAYEEK